MKFKSIHRRGPSGEKFEVGVVVGPGGREFTSGGSLVDHSRGLVVAYVSGDGRSLTTWDGKKLGTLTPTGISRGFWRSKIYHYQAVIDGIRYVGKGGGPGMFLRLRRAAKKRPSYRKGNQLRIVGQRKKTRRKRAR